MTVNGSVRTADVPPMKILLAVLREDLGLKGSKEGCGEGECGACSVLMDGNLVNACCIPAIQAAGREILTIEGLGQGAEGAKSPDTLQEAFVEEGAVHCGFCTPGMVIAARGLLEKNPLPTERDVKVALSGNLCRCTGYEKIYRAVDRAVERGYPRDFAPRKNPCAGEGPLFSAEEERDFFAPADLAEALRILEANPDLTLLAGTTDIAPDMKNGKAAPTRGMDIFRLEELHGLERRKGHLRIGACATNGEILASPTARRFFPALVEASSRSGAPAIQNRATIGGNIVTASGAADLPVILHALDASVVLASARGERRMPLEEFVVAYRRTAREPGELLKEILLPLPLPGSRQAFYKRGSRKALTLSRVSLGLCLLLEDNRIARFRLAAGSMSPIPIRLKRTEAALTGREMSPETVELAGRLASEEISPRKSSDYRRAITANLVRRFFREASR
jgi:carbon-monoxide dehydrogenase small subunit/xanthine dehydrogenase small subunit